MTSTSASLTRPIARTQRLCDGRVNAWINDQYWVLNCGLRVDHQGEHRGDLGGGLSKTWSDEDGWREGGH